MADIISTLIKEFNLKPFQVENTVKLIDGGNTIPFIARYRKEMTGELNDQVLRELNERLVYLRNLEARKEEVRRLIEEQGKLTEEITASLEKATSLREIEDIYRPFRPKRRTRATIAKEKGLEPLAQILMAQELKTGSIEDVAKPFINPEKEVNTSEDAINGAMDIVAEDISDDPQIRSVVRDAFIKQGVIVSKKKKDEDSVYRMYYDFSEPVAKIASHRVLAINRGEKEEFLQVKIEVPEERLMENLKSKLIKKPFSITSEYVEKALMDSYERLIYLRLREK
ncbi:transcription accessory protein [Acetivibrio straminisolvens JCM 21531]|uniref:Transcription accessory protein n=1 Tax=Acetivibrio straminisolvens JCM 21531 TaxID=1294263 RepID=W4V9D4_9FIRM|nr:transcription accessory protein [Acetivibrio straminisolvens JCM 21531]